MTEPETKRMKVKELSAEGSRSLIDWVIRDWKEYNAPDAIGTRKEQGTTTKQQFWNKWSKDLESIGEPRSPEQVKKKVNGELAFVRKRLIQERLVRLFGAEKKKSLLKLSESRKILRSFLISNDDFTISGGVGPRELPDSSCEDVETKDVETIDVPNDYDQKPSEDIHESSESHEKPPPVDIPISKSLSPPIRITPSNVKSNTENLSELRHELLKTELETARIKQLLTQQQYENSLKEAEKLDLMVENERIRRQLLIEEGKSKGFEMVEPKIELEID